MPGLEQELPLVVTFPSMNISTSEHRALHFDVEALLDCVVANTHAPEIAALTERPAEDNVSETTAAGVPFVQHFLGKRALLGRVEAYGIDEITQFAYKTEKSDNRWR